MKKIYITDFDIITGFGQGVNSLWENLLNNKSCLKKNDRFDCSNFISSIAGLVPDLSIKDKTSIFMQIIKKLNLSQIDLPPETKIFLATSKGEIDLLDKLISPKIDDSIINRLKIDNLLTEMKSEIKTVNDITFISAACASSSIAICEASRLISENKINSALIITCDAVSEFIFSGFSSLLALDQNPCAPFSKDRKGLNLGEGAGFILLESKSSIKNSKNKPYGEIIGWGDTNDANHITGPSRDGSGLANAIQNAIDVNHLNLNKIKSVCAHGTGTIYNDQMEMKALKRIFNHNIFVYSIKGSTGHLLGACGLIETLIAIQTLKNKTALASINLKNTDPIAKNWVHNNHHDLQKSSYVLNINSGFGGINSALIVKDYEEN